MNAVIGQIPQFAGWGPYVLAFVLGLMVAGVVATMRRRGGEAPMTRNERKSLIKSRVGMRLTDMLEDMYYKDEITYFERQDYYRKFASIVGTNDLRPRKIKKKDEKLPAQELLKHTIEERLGTHEPIPFPDRKKTLKEKLAQFYPERKQKVWTA